MMKTKPPRTVIWELDPGYNPHDTYKAIIEYAGSHSHDSNRQKATIYAHCKSRLCDLQWREVFPSDSAAYEKAIAEICTAMKF
jgi:hypothetical protein